MYETLKQRPRATAGLGLLLWSLLLTAAAVQAAPADDEYTLGVTMYSQKRWDLAAETLQGYLKKYPEHQQAAIAKLYLSQSYVNLKKYAEAREQLRDFLKAHPENKNRPQALYRVAECSYFLDDYPAAIEEFQAFLTAAPSDTLAEWAFPYLADSYLRVGKAEEAARTFQQSLEKYPTGRFLEDSRFGLARAYELLNDRDKAMAVYQTLMAQPDSQRVPEAMLNLGMLYFQQQQYPEAASTFSELVEKYPENRLVPLAQLNAGYAYYSQKQWEPALQAFEQASPHAEYGMTARYWMSQTYKSQGNYQQAEAQLQEMQNTDPPTDLQPRIAFQLADCQFLQRNYAQALASYEQYLTQYPQADQWEAAWLRAIETSLLLGRVGQGWVLSENPGTHKISEAGQKERTLLQSRLLTAKNSTDDLLPPELQSQEARWKKAEALLAPLLEALEPEETDLFAQQLRFQAAQVQTDLEQPKNVIALLEPITVKLPAESELQIPEAWLLLASSHLTLEQYSEALSAAERLLALQPAEPLQAQAELIRLTSLLEQKQLEQAETALQAYLKYPGEADKKIQAQYRLAEASYAAEDWGRAEQWYQAMVEQNPQEEWKLKAYSGLGWSQFEAGEFEQSAQTFDQLQRLFPESRQTAADSGYMRGMAELKAGRKQEAAEIFLKTAETFRTTSDQETGDEVNLIAARSAREAARSFRQLGNTAQAAAAYELAFQESEKQPANKQEKLDQLLDEWALLHYENEEYDAADKVFRLLIEKFPASERADDALLSLGESEYIAGKIDAARKTLEEVLSLPHSDSYVKRRAHYQLVLIAVEQKNLPEIEKQASAYLKDLDPQSVSLNELGEMESQLIQAYLETDQLGLARERIDTLFGRLAAAEKQETPEWLPALYVQAGELARREKNYAKAREALQTVQERFPDSAERNQLEVIVGRTYIAQAKFQEAGELFQGVIARAAGEKTLAAAQSQFYIAESALMKKDYSTALKEYIRVAVLFPGYPELQTAALFQAGQCDEVLGNKEQAIQSYENLQRLFPASEFAPKAQERIEKLRSGK